MPPTDHPWTAWFQDTVQHAQLLTNKTLRQHLLGHSAERWPEVVKATLLYGVLCLQQNFPGQPVVPLEQINEASRQLHAEAALRTALPAIRSQFESLEEEVGGFLAELDLNGPPTRGGTPQYGASTRGLQASTSAPSSAGCPSSVLGMAADPPPPRPKAKQPAIYPEWWPKDAAAASAAARRMRAASKQRPPPRLAYSRPPTAPADPTRDDLSTAAMLLVPPRVNTGRSGAQRGSAQVPREAESKVKLQHSQRLELQRQQQQRAGGGMASQVPLAPTSMGRQSNRQSPSGGGGGLAAGAVPDSAPFHAHNYSPEAVARWRQHFGLE